MILFVIDTPDVLNQYIRRYSDVGVTYLVNAVCEEIVDNYYETNKVSRQDIFNRMDSIMRDTLTPEAFNSYLSDSVGVSFISLYLILYALLSTEFAKESLYDSVNTLHKLDEYSMTFISKAV